MALTPQQKRDRQTAQRLPARHRKVASSAINQDQRLSSDGTLSPPPNDESSVQTPSIKRPIDEGHGVTSISPSGCTIVLQITHRFTSRVATHSFAVEQQYLQSASAYFDRLLSPGRFGEGERVEQRHKELREQLGNGWAGEAPVTELPVIQIEDLGRIANVKSIVPLLTDFFNILHGNGIAKTQPPVANLANLAIVADRFGALETIQDYLQRKKTLRLLDGKTTPKLEVALSEEKVRQRLLAGLLLEYHDWVEKYSAKLIVKGWIGQEVDTDAALWWDLPRRVEDEIAYRRDRILETIQSLQVYFLGLYTSKERQCKLGYDSSAQCDSFQLGEMVRFFTRMGTLQFESTITPTSNEQSPPYQGDLNMLIDTLRQVPEYQIDRFHNHCGIRTRVIPLLDLIQESLHLIGVCGECWADDRSSDSWLEAKGPLRWKRAGLTRIAQPHVKRHAILRDMYLANERDWS